MKFSPEWQRLIVFLFILLVTTAASFNSFRDVGLPITHFPVKKEYYAVDSVTEVEEAPGFLRFHLMAPHGNYNIIGLVNLRKLMHEIEVLETMNQTDHKGTFTGGAVESFKDTGRGFEKLVSEPGESVKGIGQAAGKLGGTIGRVFRKKDVGEKTTFSEAVLSSTKRKLAKELNVDVYTRNVYLDEKLTVLAKAQAGGRGAAAVAKFLIPVAGVASMVLTASGINNTADQMVNDTSKPDLFKMNKEALLNMGFQEEDVRAFLNHSYYTPREVTYIRFYLEKLKQVWGTQELLKAFQGKEGVSAYKLLHETQIAAEVFEGNPQESQLQLTPEGLGLKQGRKLVLATAYDYLDKSDLGDKVLNQAVDLKTRLSVDSVEVWNTGKVTLGFSGAALLKGAKIRGMVLFEKAEEPST